MRALARKGIIKLVGGTSLGTRVQKDFANLTIASKAKQFLLVPQGLPGMVLPLASRIAEGKPVFSSQNIKMVISATVIYYIADPITCYEAK